MIKKASHYSEKRSQRQLKVGEEIRHILAEFLARGELSHPDLFASSITLTEVQVSPDLRNATLFYTPLLASGFSQEKLQALQTALETEERSLRMKLASRMTTRHVPKLRFFYDRTFDNIDTVSKLLEHPRVRADVTKADPVDENMSGK